MAAHRARRYSLGGLVLLLAAALVTAVLVSTTGPTARKAGAATTALTWSDDFDGAAGSAPNPAKWTHETGGSGNGNHELEYYTDSTSNASLDGGGHLVITARKNTDSGLNCWYGPCQYTSARLNTAQTFTQKYGHFEARVKIPRGQGVWPAFWMLGDDIGTVGWPNSGELDVMENIGKEPGTVHGTIHGPGYSGSNGLGAAYTLPGGKAFADDFHTFAVDWSPSAITWSVDGTTYETRTPADAGGNKWVFDHPFDLILNLAVGGDWPGSPDSSTSVPQSMTIDYVRVSASDSGSGTTGGSTGSSTGGSSTSGGTSGGSTGGSGTSGGSTGGSTGGTSGGSSGGSTGGTGGTASGAIKGIGGMCVDIANASTADRTPIQLHNCTGNPAQQWTLGADHTVRALGKCLDVAGASTADDAAVQLYSCNGSSAQQWTYTAAHDLTNIGANKCLATMNGSAADGTHLHTWTCTGAPDEKWTVG